MRHQTHLFLEKFIKEKGHRGEVLEVGSLDVNGSVRAGLNDCSTSYWGIDMRKGTNVDQVVNGHDLVSVFGKDKFDTVICVDTIEHDDEFWVTIDQIKQVLKPGGYLLLGAPGRACPLHDHPDDYWRFMPSAFTKLFEGMEDVYVETEYQDEHYLNQQIEAELYGWGRKI
jgi:SAM-dependent methyltransferase